MRVTIVCFNCRGCAPLWHFHRPMCPARAFAVMRNFGRSRMPSNANPAVANCDSVPALQRARLQRSCRSSSRVLAFAFGNEQNFYFAYGRSLVDFEIALPCLHPVAQLVEVGTPDSLDFSIVCPIALCTFRPEADGSKLELITPDWHPSLRHPSADWTRNA